MTPVVLRGTKPVYIQVETAEQTSLNPFQSGLCHIRISAELILVNAINKPMVLLVEDSEDDAYLFNWRFEQSGATCAVEHVLDGSAAIEFLLRSSATSPKLLPFIIFLDLKMPVMNGFEVLAWLQKHEAFSHIPVVVLSGSDQPSDKERACQLGAADYLVKPLKVDDIHRFLGDVCPSHTLDRDKAQT
jgi:CheY-like chemotaxis protein